MIFALDILGTSSSGNCALLRTKSGIFLIDAGFSGKKIIERLSGFDISLFQIKGVFLTHEHSDHSCGIRGLINSHPKLAIYTTYSTAKSIQDRLNREANWKIFTANTQFYIGELLVKSFSIPHDAEDPVGFYFNWGERDLFNLYTSLAWITDLGHTNEQILKNVIDADILVLESNYDEELLESDQNRPQYIKDRTFGRHGHLSNSQAYQFLENHYHAKWKKVYLAHLSKDCNSSDAILRTFLKRKEKIFFPFTLEIYDPLNDILVNISDLKKHHTLYNEKELPTH